MASNRIKKKLARGTKREIQEGKREIQKGKREIQKGKREIQKGKRKNKPFSQSSYKLLSYLWCREVLLNQY